MTNLQRIRNEKGISQSQLSQISGINISSIKKYETGERDIMKAQVSTVLVIAKALKCNIEDLLELE